MTPFYSFWQQWFAQPLEEKMKRARSLGLGGYWPPASETPGFTGKPDPKEYYQWRLKEAGFGGQSDTERTFWSCYHAGRRWLGVRGLSEVVDSVKADDCVLRIIHYPPTADGCVGEAHRDFDLLTVNVGGTAPGLEVFDPRECEVSATPGICAHLGDGCDSDWTPREGGIHVGEMLEIYTARTALPGVRGNEIATTHRVRTPPNTERFAAVFFFLPPMDFVLRPGLTADGYLNAAPGSRADGWVGVLRRAGTYTGVAR